MASLSQDTDKIEEDGPIILDNMHKSQMSLIEKLIII